MDHNLNAKPKAGKYLQEKWEEKSVTGLDKDFLDKKLKSIIPRKINKLDLLKLMFFKTY